MTRVRLIVIPASTQAVKCNCGRFFYQVRNEKSGNYEPVRVNLERSGHLHPTKVAAGAGESHFADCPNADAHRRARRVSRA